MEENIKLQEDGSDETDRNPKIYSKRAIWGFSVFFSSIFGAVLLMQNLRDIGKKSEANLILLLSILYTAITIYIVNIPEKPQTSLTLMCNMVGGLILTEFVYKKYFSDDQAFEKKKIWKPLIISISISAIFILALVYQI